MIQPAVRQRVDVAAVCVGRGPDPLDLVPLAYQTWEGRYDDPDRTWRTLYLASHAYGTWVEGLGRFRPTTTSRPPSRTSPTRTATRTPCAGSPHACPRCPFGAACATSTCRPRPARATAILARLAATDGYASGRTPFGVSVSALTVRSSRRRTCSTNRGCRNPGSSASPMTWPTVRWPCSTAGCAHVAAHGSGPSSGRVAPWAHAAGRPRRDPARLTDARLEGPVSACGSSSDERSVPLHPGRIRAQHPTAGPSDGRPAEALDEHRRSQA